MPPSDTTQLAQQIKSWGQALGFADVGISDCNLSEQEAQYFNWLGENYHGEMGYMQEHGTKRTRPQELVPGTQSIVSVRMNYFSDSPEQTLKQLEHSEQAYISRYALGKDYHKVMRKRLQQLAQKILDVEPQLSYRAFADSAPVLETSIAHKAELGFKGKHSLIIHPRAGSWFFLGELYLSISLPTDAEPMNQGCGPCTACIDECPTGAILPNNQVDARKCISYLTIESKAPIPIELRSQIGNRIYGCDDCQLVCPWNRFLQPNQKPAFTSLYDLSTANLLELWQWSEQKFLRHFEGSAIRRIGYEYWQRNLAVAIGNIDSSKQQMQAALQQLQASVCTSALVQEHIDWAIEQLSHRLSHPSDHKHHASRRYYLGKRRVEHSLKADQK